MKTYNGDFSGKCCDTNYGTCDWTCDEIEQRILSRAPLGLVYNRSEIDSKINTLRSLISIAAASNSIIIDSLSNRPLASPGNAGYLFVTNDPVSPSGPSYPQYTYVSNGTSWIELINREDFTAQSTFTGDMEKALFTGGTDIIDVVHGGTGSDLSLEPNGILTINNGTVTSENNYLSTEIQPVALVDIQLTVSHASVQIFNASVGQTVLLPVVPEVNTYFRIINTSATNTLDVEYLSNPVKTVAASAAIDLHYDSVSNTWIVINLDLD